jgi:hypothetical protein
MDADIWLEEICKKQKKNQFIFASFGGTIGLTSS